MRMKHTEVFWLLHRGGAEGAETVPFSFFGILIQVI